MQKMANVVVSTLATFDVLNATPGTIMLDATGGTAWLVQIVGGVPTLVQVGAAGVIPTLVRTLSVVITPGAPASGEVEYAITLVDGNGQPVPLGLVYVGVERSVGAGALSLAGVSLGQLISAVDDSTSSALALVGMCSAAGLFTFTVQGTAADTIATSMACDAAAGGDVSVDAGRVLP